MYELNVDTITSIVYCVLYVDTVTSTAVLTEDQCWECAEDGHACAVRFSNICIVYIICILTYIHILDIAPVYALCFLYSVYILIR